MQYDHPATWRRHRRTGCWRDRNGRGLCRSTREGAFKKRACSVFRAAAMRGMPDASPGDGPAMTTQWPCSVSVADNQSCGGEEEGTMPTSRAYLNRSASLATPIFFIALFFCELTVCLLRWSCAAMSLIFMPDTYRRMTSDSRLERLTFLLSSPGGLSSVCTIALTVGEKYWPPELAI